MQSYPYKCTQISLVASFFFLNPTRQETYFLMTMVRLSLAILACLLACLITVIGNVQETHSLVLLAGMFFTPSLCA